MKKTFAIIGLTVLFVLLVEFLIYKLSNNDKKYTVKEYRKSKSEYKMINPVLDFYELEPVLVREVKDLQSEISDYIEKAVKEQKVETVSVYFRDLNNGPWIGIGEDEPYAPASLLKVPFMIAVLKTVEADTSFFSKKILYDTLRDNARRNIVDDICIIKGKKYTVRQLLEYMIIHSDNDAKNLLIDNVNSSVLHDIFYDLGIPINSYRDKDFLTVKDYASYFRILYNATYLNKEMSEWGLELLTRTTYNEGIVAGVPKNIVVAHKFGERHFTDDDTRELHDCGIIYKANKPYLICIMTKGKDYTLLAKAIADISAIVYNSEATASEK